MTSMKTVLLGSAAAIVATGAAQAADLPVKKAAAAVQYVEVCPVYGAGFYKLPGTDICIRHFGSLKINIGYTPAVTAYDGRADTVTVSGNGDTTGWQWTVRPGWDFRSPTEWGTLRAVVQMRMDQRNGMYERVSPRTPDDPGSDVTGAQRPSAHRAYLEWAGFTIGRAGSMFPYWDQDDVVSSVGGDPKTTTTMISYTWAGPGLKATIGLEDNKLWETGITRNRDVNGGIDAIADGPQGMYDVIGTLSTEGTWGSAKVAGALHQISEIAAGPGIDCTTPSIPGTAGGSCPTVRETGWGALAGVTFLLPALGAGDQILLQASYGNGALAYAGVGGGSDARPSSFERAGQWSGGLLRRDFDAHVINDGAGGFTLEKEKATSVVAQYRHYWNPLLRSNLMAGKTWIRPGAITKATALTDGGLGNAEILDVAANLIWGKSRKTAEVGVEVLYKKVKQDLPGASVLPVGIEQNPSQWGVVGFIQRAW